MEKINKYLDLLKWSTKTNVLNLLKNEEYNSKKFIDFLSNVLEEEYEFIRARQKIINLKTASFPSIKTLEEFDFNFQPSINENKILELATLKFVEEKKNIIFVGNSGVGKTHLAIALGVEAIEHKLSTYFLHYSKLIFELKKAKERNMFEERVRYFARYKVLIIDEIGYLPLDKESGNMLFQLVNKFYENKSIIITTNKPFDEWGEMFNDDTIASAILDRLIHHSVIINILGKSFRTHHSLEENGISIEEIKE